MAKQAQMDILIRQEAVLLTLKQHRYNNQQNHQ